METVVQAISHTPWWVFVLFVILVRRGIKALKPSTASLKGLMLLPLVFLAFSVHTLFLSTQPIFETLGLWLIGGCVGGAIAYMVTPLERVSVDLKNKTLNLPGSAYVLIMVLCAFVVKYALGYQLAAHPEIIHNIGFTVVLLATAGLFTGLSVGRASRLLYRLYQVPVVV
ncbi:DUF6622 family protein [Piscirickettsia litoralis]|uniref:DUF1453 domain-containing protein n=1 Tax=Piscirickettsia litoralis TaxID=1891921 RepID=A0ABX2ZZE8_9GAMM|nr:DUF6622 family protein [Piscirickettsia litoralis]ODN41769.1 hypothetical protein BGC07_00705 [Piscirickettsia litoralis]